jgi:hypothetical protein
MRTRSRLVVSGLFVLAGSLASAATALAPASANNGAPIGGCPTPEWHLFTTAFVIEHVPSAAGDPSLDGNGDMLTCVLFVDHGRVAYRDNNVNRST